MKALTITTKCFEFRIGRSRFSRRRTANVHKMLSALEFITILFLFDHLVMEAVALMKHYIVKGFCALAHQPAVFASSSPTDVKKKDRFMKRRGSHSSPSAALRNEPPIPTTTTTTTTDTAPRISNGFDMLIPRWLFRVTTTPTASSMNADWSLPSWLFGATTPTSPFNDDNKQQVPNCFSIPADANHHTDPDVVKGLSDHRDNFLRPPRHANAHLRRTIRPQPQPQLFVVDVIDESPEEVITPPLHHTAASSNASSHHIGSSGSNDEHNSPFRQCAAGGGGGGGIVVERPVPSVEVVVLTVPGAATESGVKNLAVGCEDTTRRTASADRQERKEGQRRGGGHCCQLIAFIKRCRSERKQRKEMARAAALCGGEQQLFPSRRCHHSRRRRRRHRRELSAASRPLSFRPTGTCHCCSMHIVGSNAFTQTAVCCFVSSMCLFCRRS